MPHFSDLPLSAIDTADQKFRISRADSDISALALSISLNGLLTPLIVLEQSDNKFSIVSGFKRISAAESLQLETIPCRIIPRSQIKACPVLAVTENAFQRELTPGELVRAAGILATEMTPHEMADQSTAIFNTRLNKGYIKSLIDIHQLGARALALLENGQLSMKAAVAIAAMDDELSLPLMDLFSKIKVSSGKQMEIVTWTREITARDEITLAELINEEEILSLLDPDTEHKDLGAIGNRLRAALYQKRFPELDKTKKETIKKVQALKLSKGLRLSLPENFESMVYTFSMEFRSFSEFNQRFNALSDLRERDELKEILDR